MKTKISKHVTPLIQKDPGQYSVMTDPHAAMKRGSGKGQLNPPWVLAILKYSRLNLKQIDCSEIFKMIKRLCRDLVLLGTSENGQSPYWILQKTQISANSFHICLRFFAMFNILYKN